MTLIVISQDQGLITNDKRPIIPPVFEQYCVVCSSLFSRLLYYKSFPFILFFFFTV